MFSLFSLKDFSSISHLSLNLLTNTSKTGLLVKIKRKTPALVDFANFHWVFNSNKTDTFTKQGVDAKLRRKRDGLNKKGRNK